MNNQKNIIIILFLIVISIALFPSTNVSAQPACEWDGMDECCGRIVPCNGGTYGPYGDYCLGTSAPPGMCPY